MKTFFRLISFMGLTLLLASMALAHGGNYTGPGGNGTAGGFAPGGQGNPGPPPHPGGSGTNPGNGVGGGGVTGGTSGSSPGSGGGSSAPGSPAGAPGSPGGNSVPGSSTGGNRRKPASNANVTWAAWWFFNDDRFLDLKAKVRREENETQNADLFEGAVDQTDAVTPVNAKMIRDKINPILKFALKDDFYDTRAAALIALGKTGHADTLADLLSLTDDRDKRVRESAFLAMGILGNKEAIAALIDVMNDSKKGRKLVGRPNGILSRTRAFAALSIGLIGSRHSDLSDTDAVQALIVQMSSERVVHEDIQIAPIVALGVMKAKESVPALIAFLDNKDNQTRARSYAAVSLGKIGSPAAVKSLLKGLKGKNAVVQSCAIALGQLAKSDDVKVVKALQKLVKSSPYLGAKNFAIISMGEIGGAANLDELIRMSKKGNIFMRTFSAMGLAIYMDKFQGDSEKDRVCRRLHKFFKNEKNPALRGANAIALGIMRYKVAGEDILMELKKSSYAPLRSHLCLSLGLMDYDPAIKEVRATVTDKGDIDLRRNAAIALGLLGDKGALKVLQDEMNNSVRSKAVHGAVTQGLGFIGDVSAVPVLVKFVRDVDQYQDVTRAFAAVALGLLGDKDNIPVLSKISEHNNYLQRTDALGELLSIL